MSAKLANSVGAYPYCYQANVCYNRSSQSPGKAYKNNRWTRKWVKTTKTSASDRADSVFLINIVTGSSKPSGFAEGFESRPYGQCESADPRIGLPGLFNARGRVEVCRQRQLVRVIGSIIPCPGIRVRDKARRDCVQTSPKRREAGAIRRWFDRRGGHVKSKRGLDS